MIELSRFMQYLTSESIHDFSNHRRDTVLNFLESAATSNGRIKSKYDSNFLDDVLKCCRSGTLVGANVIKQLIQNAYALSKLGGNTRKLTVPPGGKLIVVGDLHGQLHDLLRILDEAGLPSPTNIFVFNGNYIDRGYKDVEVMTLVTSLFLCKPDFVVLNRGNHEDEFICRHNGFHRNCSQKYDEFTFALFCELFKQLPLCALINQSVLILHGGLFNNRSVSLGDLDKINRADEFVAYPPVAYPDCMITASPELRWKEYYKQLMRELLWSDPRSRHGIAPNVTRGGIGVEFGPDACKAFMRRNNISMIIRSHQCVRYGVDFPYIFSDDDAYTGFKDYSYGIMGNNYPKNSPLLVTVFSASNYNLDNDGAYIVLTDNSSTQNSEGGTIRIKHTSLHFSINRFNPDNKSSNLNDTKYSSLIADKYVYLTELICKKKSELQMQFELIDTQNSGYVTRTDWAKIIRNIIGVETIWLRLVNKICPPESLSASFVNYRLFLLDYNILYSTVLPTKSAQKYTNSSKQSTKSMFDSLDIHRANLHAAFQIETNSEAVTNGTAYNNDAAAGSSSEILDSYFEHRFKLLAAFESLDSDKDGVLSVYNASTLYLCNNFVMNFGFWSERIRL